MLVLNTRATSQADALTQLLTKKGATVIHCPTLCIEPISLTTQHIMQAKSAQTWIFLSANAVSNSLPFLLNQITCQDIFKKNIFAVGPATAQQLLKYKISAALPQNFNSQGIIKLLSKNFHDTVAIFCVQHTQSPIKKSCIKKNIPIFEIACYKSYCPKVAPSITTERIDFIVSQSLESLKNLHHLLKIQIRKWQSDARLVVISHKMFTYAIKQGWNQAQILLATDPTNQAVVEKIINVQVQ